jgi:hypothetical protein
MKTILLVGLFYLFVQPIFSQNASYVLHAGQDYERNKGYQSKEGVLYVSSREGSQATINKQNPKAYFLEEGNVVEVKGKNITSYDAKTLKVNNSIPIKNFPEDRKVLGSVQFQGEHIVFFSAILTKKAKTVQCFFQKLNIETGMLEREVAIFEVEKTRENLRKNGFHHVSFYPLPTFSLSKDGSKLEFSCRGKMSVYEKGMNLMWKTENVYGEHSPKRFYDLQDGMLDNDGTYYAILKVFKNDDNAKLEWHHWESHSELVSKKDRKCNYTISALKINGEGVTKLPTNGLKDLLVHSLTLHRDAEDKLICLGLYFKDEKLFRTEGILSLELEVSDAPVYYPVPNESQDALSKKEKGKTGGIKYLNGLEIKNTADGNLLVISEQVNGFFLQPSTGEYSSLGNYGDVLVSKINLKGELLWMKRLQKSQIYNINTSNGDFFGCESYKYLDLNGKHYIVYLDNKKNKDSDYTTLETYCSSCKNGAIFAFVLDEDGNVKKEMLFDLDKISSTSEYNFKENMRTISETEFIFPFIPKKKSEGLVKITVK